MAGKSPPQFKILNDTRDIVTLMTSFFCVYFPEKRCFFIQRFSGQDIEIQ